MKNIHKMFVVHAVLIGILILVFGAAVFYYTHSSINAIAVVIFMTLFCTFYFFIWMDHK